MGRASIILALSIMVLAMPMVIANLARGPEAVKKWVGELKHKSEKVTEIHFYFHDNVSGGDINSWQVAQPNITANSPASFGLINMADNILTEGPDPKSTAVGRAQGLYGSASLSGIDFLMNYNLVFTQGEYNKSTLNLQGWYPVIEEYREMAITGGSGVFRLARGIATSKTYHFDKESRNVIVEYNLVVIHY